MSNNAEILRQLTMARNYRKLAEDANLSMRASKADYDAYTVLAEKAELAVLRLREKPSYVQPVRCCQNGFFDMPHNCAKSPGASVAARGCEKCGALMPLSRSQSRLCYTCDAKRRMGYNRDGGWF